MPITKDKLHNLLKSEFDDGVIVITDLAGDDDHWEASVSSRKFDGKSRVQQHQMVFAAVKDEDIHALSIKTKAI